MGVTLTRIGAVPFPFGRATDRVRVTAPVFVSMTAIRSWAVTATKARGCLGSTAIPSGWERCGPTWMVPVTAPEERSILLTVPSVSLVT